jgi:probable HAF family extracellular repeat protein
MTDLGTVGDDPCSDASVINSRGQAVGVSSDCQSHVLHTYLWENGGPMVDLRSLVLPGSDITVAENLSINDRGEIAAAGQPNCVAGEPCDKHSILLLPCDDAHPNIEGCDYDTVDQDTAAQVRAMPLTSPSTLSANPVQLSSADRMARIRSMIAGRHHRFAALPPK